ncbi:MAG: hypothetical protein QE265_13010 [Rhodoferax sp.]|nr:hypothetical protein [Rhodoferax sp.]
MVGSPVQPSGQSRRGWERAWLLLGIGGLCAGWWVYGHSVRSDAERVALQSSLAALRTALVVDDMRRAAARAGSAPVADAPGPRNPFDLLERRPANYAGESSAGRLPEVTGGSWVFDRGCACVGYKPHDEEALESPAGAQALWFSLQDASAGTQLRAMQAYVWRGHRIE